MKTTSKHMLLFKKQLHAETSFSKGLTPSAAKRHEAQKIMDTVKTATAFISTALPAIRSTRGEKQTDILGKTNRGKRRTGNWEVVRGEREGEAAWDNKAEGRRARRTATSAVFGTSSSFQVPPISSDCQSQHHNSRLTLSLDLLQTQLPSALTKLSWLLDSLHVSFVRLFP